MNLLTKPIREIENKILNINSDIAKVYDSYDQIDENISTTEIIDLEFRIEMLYQIKNHLILHKQ